MSELKASKYQAYPEYKDSGVEWLGSIPSHWQVIPVKHLAALTPKKSAIDAELLSQECSFLPMEKLKLNSITLDEKRLVSDVYNGYTYFEDGDVLMAKVTPCFENKNIAVASGLLNGIGFGSSEIYVLRSNGRVNNRFLYYRLQEDSFMYIAIAAMSGAGGLKRVPSEIVSGYSLAKPELAEQTQIANFLDHETARIDTLIEKQQQLIELLKEKRQAVISHAVTKGLNPNVPMKDSGVEWLGEVPAHWIASTLKHYSEVIDCKHITAEFFDDGIPLASISEVKKWFVDLSTAKYTSEKYYNELIGGGREPKVGDIIYSRNATVGEAAIVSEGLPPFAMGQDVCLIRLSNGLLPLFAMYVLHSSVISQQLELAMVGSTFKRINVDNIRNFAFVIPPLSEQDLIVSELEALTSKYDVLINNATNAIELMKERRTALISAAVTGKIDVRNWEQPND
ncbi:MULTISPECIES: restriction endonuclease subunit S [unclassified Pseudoalteromonas]|uniref:restriction endonuclease subunit S n=1 Tax=unclassified Pseudoalteromonas TaxID=194690 RepID=UPI0025B2B14D|nr:MULTISPECIES: restriction endonuclease subunit S [unclassified Pseudoalteromonas]MDN3380957.1 restriction endonuclease subunit S [Pseudoalteromonas sp. APC 3893]MDN3389364.1 restriction endonuclease subunit S [Pseudoalteromonas sp. APC 4017]